MTLIEDFVATSGITYKENGIAQPSIGGNTFTRIYQDSLTISGKNEDNGIIIWDSNKNITFGGTQITITDGFDNDGTLTLTSSLIVIENLVLNNGTVNLLGSTNFDSVIWDSDTAGTFAFGSDSALNITSSSNGKTLIKCTTITGTITLDVEDGVQNGDTFSIEATDNQLIINSGEWEATPSTSGNITTYTLARVQPALPVSLKKKLRKKLALMLANLKKKRKYYCEVEYLESTGTQYINTGLLSTANSKVDCVFGFSSMESGAANNVGVFGGRNATTTNTFTLFKIASATPQYFRFDYNGQPSAATENQMAWNTTSKYRLEYMGAQIIATNLTTGESVTTTRSPGSTFTQYPIYLFAVNTAGTIGQHLSGRIYHYWYTDGTNSIDLIPVLDWNGVSCMYDKVSGELFYNQGTGDFIAGREIHYVEYLESSGTQYIDTGYIPNANTYVEMNAMYISLDSTYRTPFSVRTSDGAANSFTISGATNTSNVYAFGSQYWAEANGCPDASTNVKYFMSLKSGVANFNGVTGNAGTTITPTSLTAYMFARNANGTAANFFIGRIYDCQIKDNNSLVRDFIPAIDENGVGFMFDRVSHTCFLNQGTGAFKYPARELEYLESTGTQYIDTDYTPIDNSVVRWEANVGYASGSINRRFLLSDGNSSKNHYSEIDNSNKYGCGQAQITTELQPNMMYSVAMQINGGTNVEFEANGEYAETTSFQSSSFGELYLFRLNQNYTGSGQRIGENKIIVNSTLVRDFIPCYKDGQAGMLDKLTGTLYTNQGTGSFSTGRIIEPEYE